MRLWSIHLKYLDEKGLVALWRESLLAQKVLSWKKKISPGDFPHHSHRYQNKLRNELKEAV